jgi:hypothetical protein
MAAPAARKLPPRIANTASETEAASCDAAGWSASGTGPVGALVGRVLAVPRVDRSVAASGDG